MMRVKIAELKTHLSNYLRRVRAGGEIVVTDRETPIARLVPYAIGPKRGRLMIRPARASPKTLSQLNIPPAPAGTDSLKALLEERADDLDQLS